MSTSTIDTETLENSVQTGVNQLLRGGWGEALKTILFALLLLVICLVIKAILLKLLDRGLNRFSQVEKSLHTFIRSMANILLWFITLMVVADSLGINASSLLALVSILGLAVSLSVKDSLSNLAGGLTILGTKPFKVGDYVEIGETGGTVQEIGLVYTKLTTIDNRRILMPNSLVVDAQVTNYTTEPLRRVDLTVSASYDAPVEKGLVDRVLGIEGTDITVRMGYFYGSYANGQGALIEILDYSEPGVSMTEQGGSGPGNGGIFTQAFETKDLDKLLARCEAFGYKTASERTTVTLESVGEIDTVLVSGVNGTLYQFYQVK